jgi:hypothetical protein
VFLGSDDFVKEHLELLKLQEGDLSEVPKKQRRARALPLEQYEKQTRVGGWGQVFLFALLC